MRPVNAFYLRCVGAAVMLLLLDVWVNVAPILVLAVAMMQGFACILEEMERESND